MSGQASRLGLGEVVIGDINYGRRYLQGLQAICSADLQALRSAIWSTKACPWLH